MATIKSIEQKAQRYDEALEMAKKLIENEETNVPVFYVNNIKDIFPELKESIDERIKKVIKQVLSESTTEKDECYLDNGVTQQEVFAWLEKQGGQKPIDKIEPKFKVGDWIVWKDKCYKVNYNGCGYELVDQDGLSTSLEYGTINENAHIWDVTTDAKDGDILVSRSPFIYGKQYPYGGLNWYNNNFFKASNFIFTDSPVHPATKEQRDLLFVKMKEAGYEWDEEKKEPKKISQRMVSAEVKEALYDKPAWSEEDESWFKEIELMCLNFSNDTDYREKFFTWLKSLKERYTWKPSDEEMKALADALSLAKSCGEDYSFDLRTLYEQLKKLKKYEKLY